MPMAAWLVLIVSKIATRSLSFTCMTPVSNLVQKIDNTCHVICTFWSTPLQATSLGTTGGRLHSSTGLFRISLGDDKHQSSLFRISLGEDKHQSSLFISLGEDKHQSSLFRISLGEDKDQSSLFRISFGEDKHQSSLGCGLMLSSPLGGALQSSVGAGILQSSTCNKKCDQLENQRCATSSSFSGERLHESALEDLLGSGSTSFGNGGRTLSVGGGTLHSSTGGAAEILHSSTLSSWSSRFLTSSATDLVWAVGWVA